MPKRLVSSWLVFAVTAACSGSSPAPPPAQGDASLDGSLADVAPEACTPVPCGPPCLPGTFNSPCPPPVDAQPPIPDVACTPEPYPTAKKNVDVYFLVDRSAAMSPGDAGPLSTRWSGFVQNLKTFFAQAATTPGLGVGLGFFPVPARDGDGSTPASCAASDYVPAVAMAPLGDAGQVAALSASLDVQFPSGGAPTTPAIDGALSYAKTWARSHPEREVAFILVTAATPNECNSTNQNIRALLTRAFTESPSISSFLVGFGEAATTVDIWGFEAGYFAIEPGPRLLQSLQGALGDADPCRISIPQPEAGPVHPELVNIGITYQAGAPEELLPRHSSRDGCGTSKGWYYEGLPGSDAAPPFATLCFIACRDLTASASVRALLGCPSNKTIVTLKTR